MAKPGVRVEGLRDLQKALKAVSNEAAKELRQANLVSARVVADDGRPKVPRSRRAKRRHLQDTVRPVATQTGAGVRIGGAANPYPWVALPAVLSALEHNRHEVFRAASRAIDALVDRHFD